MAPWGSGRTEIYLLGPLVILIVLGLDNAVRMTPRWSAPIAALLTGGIILMGSLPPRPDYPNQDVGPLVSTIEEQRRPGDGLVIYPPTRYAYALYSSSPVTIVPDEAQANGFTVEIHNAVILPLFRREPARYLEPLRRATAGHPRVWFVASHFREDIDVLRQHFSTLGYTAVHVEERGRALLVLYTR